MIHLARLLNGLVSVALLTLCVILLRYIINFIFDHFAMIAVLSVMVGSIYLIGAAMLESHNDN